MPKSAQIRPCVSPKLTLSSKSYSSDATHRDYVVAAAYLRAENYSIAPTKMSNEELAKFAAGVKVAEFKPKQVKIATTDAEGKTQRLTSF